MATEHNIQAVYKMAEQQESNLKIPTKEANTTKSESTEPAMKEGKGAATAPKPMPVEQETREIVSEAKAMSELLARLQESLTRAGDKNDSLLEAIEATEARASRENAAESEVRAWR